MQSNTTSGISHLRYLDNNSGSVCLTVSNSALMTRVLLQRKHRKGHKRREVEGPRETHREQSKQWWRKRKTQTQLNIELIKCGILSYEVLSSVSNKLYLFKVC